MLTSEQAETRKRMDAFTQQIIAELKLIPKKPSLSRFQPDYDTNEAAANTGYWGNR